MIHPFPPGTKVTTNQAYFELYGRKVTGESIVLKDAYPPPHLTVMRWEHQEGNVIQAHQGNAVIMMTADLEALVKH